MKKRIRYGLIIIIFIILGIFIVLSNSVRMSDFTIQDETEKIKEAKTYGDEVVGWLRVEGTNIDLPLIRATDQTDVITADYDFAWTNSNPDQNSNRPAYISHNIRNVSSNPIVGDETMRRFESLMSFIYPEFLEENQFIEYTDASGETALYRIYAVALLEDNQEASFFDTYTKEEQAAYIDKVKEESLYTMSVDVSSDDLLLTLFTCTRFYGASTNYSLRVDARKLRANEEKKLYDVKKSKHYQKIEARMKEGVEDEEV